MLEIQLVHEGSAPLPWRAQTANGTVRTRIYRLGIGSGDPAWKPRHTVRIQLKQREGGPPWFSSAVLTHRFKWAELTRDQGKWDGPVSPEAFEEDADRLARVAADILGVTAA